jgi:GNAT superfamily N-acetyltransferase
MRRDESVIRLAEPADTPFVRNCAARLAEQSRLPWLPTEATDRFAATGCSLGAEAIGDPAQLVLIAADCDTSALGFVHAHLDRSAFTGETVGYIATVVVAEAAAGRGVGRRLIEAAEAWSRARGCRLVTLEVFGANEIARAVYQRLGYSEQTLKLAKPLE